MKEIQEEAKVVLEKAQKEIKKYADRKRAEVDEYKVGDLVMLRTKNLKYQIVGRRTEKLTERFVGPYKIKKIVLLNTVELELPSTVKIHPVVWIQEKDKYLVQWKGFMVESDTWEERKNLENAKEAIEEYEKEYWQDMEDIRQQEEEEGIFRRGELPEQFTVKKLFK